jgi:hypothetical protein
VAGVTTYRPWAGWGSQRLHSVGSTGIPVEKMGCAIDGAVETLC